MAKGVGVSRSTTGNSATVSGLRESQRPSSTSRTPKQMICRFVFELRSAVTTARLGCKSRTWNDSTTQVVENSCGPFEMREAVSSPSLRCERQGNLVGQSVTDGAQKNSRSNDRDSHQRHPTVDGGSSHTPSCGQTGRFASHGAERGVQPA